LQFRRAQMDRLTEQTSQLRIVQRAQHAKFSEGLVTQLEVFETDRSLLAAEQQIAAIHQRILTDTVTLYKALGGGWTARLIAER
nr:hypothetical protein [Gammaproteobacteria bacterium]